MRFVYAEIGVDLPLMLDDHLNSADRVAIAALIDGAKPEWLEVKPGAEQSFDAILVSIGGVSSHIGVVVRPGLMLHALEGTASVIEQYRNMKWRRRVVGFFRHRGLA